MYPATRPLTAPPVKLDNTAAIPKTTKNPSYVNAVVMKSSTHELGDNKAAMAERAWHSDIGRKETMMQGHMFSPAKQADTGRTNRMPPPQTPAVLKENKQICSRSQSTLNGKQNEKPIAGTKMKTSIAKATKDVHEAAYTNTWEKPNHLHNDYMVEVRPSVDIEPQIEATAVGNGQDA